MKEKIAIAIAGIILASCGTAPLETNSEVSSNPLTGTWQLVSGTLIAQGDTTVTHYTNGISFIKIINDTHFAFLQHDLTKGKDSAVFVSGGGRYTLADSVYTEKLEYCSAREWEGNDFTFTVALQGDTLVQRGIEKVDEAGVNRENIETYIRIKN
ncbi:hypothetical protein [Pontibacter liquoris]|uniref:hypothetical protein n=1 Tax=Pontibacter liquoris TaxID=2905677 RepID=UPI001FA6CBEC|nr:hypothetical protein [Pontibacter liquoris]